MKISRLRPVLVSAPTRWQHRYRTLHSHRPDWRRGARLVLQSARQCSLARCLLLGASFGALLGLASGDLLIETSLGAAIGAIISDVRRK